MSKLNIEQKTIKDLLIAKKADFLIPDYQRLYAWTADECSTLWDDLFSFALPGDGEEKFDENEEYFLGPIVTFRNNDEKIEIIDGQQRLTTMMLLLRAFCSKFEFMKDGTPMDELFTRYMYFERAKQGNRNTTTEALRVFYERDSYKLLKSEETLANLEALAVCWMSVAEQDGQLFSKRVLRCLFVLNYAPNGMWTYIVSVWFMTHKDSKGRLDEQEFYEFLHKITAFIWAYAIERPGVNSLRTPVYPELIRIVKGKKVEFAEHRFDREELRACLIVYPFNNGRPITRSMLAWWAFQDEKQELLELSTVFEIEYIYAKKRAEIENVDRAKLEALGNKALLEKRINIRASDYRFEDKKKYYRGFESARGYRAGTGNRELLVMADQREDFSIQAIKYRTTVIIGSFMDYLGENGLLVRRYPTWSWLKKI